MTVGTKSPYVFSHTPRVNGFWILQIPMVDDITGEPLIKRKDDNAETLKNRLSAFHEQTMPIIKHYSERVVDLKADQSPDDVCGQIREAMSNSA